MQPKFELKPGEKEFFEKFQKHPHFEEIQKEPHSQKSQERIREFLQELTKDIEAEPEIQREAQLHHQVVGDIAAVVAQAIQVALDEGVLAGLRHLQKIGAPPYFIDTYHDLLAGHFYQALIKYNKLKQQ